MLGLCSLRTESCCCGISLRTGTITILVLNLIGCVSVTLNHRQITHGASFWVGQVIFLVIEIIALYGVYKKKPDFLIPHLAITAIFLITFLLCIIGLLILLPFCGKIMHEMTYETPDGKSEHLSKTVIDSFYVIYAVILVAAIVYEFVEFHFFKVVLSHYRELKTVLLNVNPPPPIGFVA